MADYRKRTDDFLQAGYRVVALSVDEPQRTEHLRRTLSLSFSILCDVERQVVRGWDLFNPGEKGGIAVPATFVACLRGRATQAAKRTLRPAMLRALRNMFRYGLVSPQK